MTSPVDVGDLSVTDLTFLRTVRDINSDPDSYQGTDKSEKPANVSSMQEASDLSKTQIRYRIRPASASNTAGWDEAGLLKLYGSDLDDSGRRTPRSCELTQRGRELLSEARSRGEMEKTDPETVKQIESRLDALESINEDASDDGSELTAVKSEIQSLKDRVDALETRDRDRDTDVLERMLTQIDRLSSRIDRIEASRRGAVDKEYINKIDAAMSAAYQLEACWQYLLCEDPERADPAQASTEEIEEARRHMLQILRGDDPDALPLAAQQRDERDDDSE